MEKQRLEQDVDSLRHFMEEERKEMAELRRQQQVCQPTSRNKIILLPVLY